MTTATAPAVPPARPGDPRPAVVAACDLMASDWSAWHMLLSGLTWADYERLLAAREAAGRRGVRITYDRGQAEVVARGGSDRPAGGSAGGVTAMTVTFPHERWKSLATWILQTLALHHGLPLVTAGHATVRRPDLDRGVEPDVWFYLGPTATQLAPAEVIDFARFPPDLAVEIEVSRTVLDRLDICAALGIGEVWRFDGERLAVLHLAAGLYSPAPVSRWFPAVPIDAVAGYLKLGRTVDDATLFRQVQEWVRTLPAQQSV